MTQTWVAVLADVPDDLLKRAAQEYMQSGETWRPAPGQLRAKALELMQGTKQCQALSAWEKILSSNFGREPIDDPAALRAMNLAGGFEAFGQSDITQGEWWQKRFCMFYEELSKEEVRLRLPNVTTPLLANPGS